MEPTVKTSNQAASPRIYVAPGETTPSPVSSQVNACGEHMPLIDAPTAVKTTEQEESLNATL